MDDMQMIDLSDKTNVKKNDKFMNIIIILIVVLIVMSLVIYFFGYPLFEPFIKV